MIVKESYLIYEAKLEQKYNKEISFVFKSEFSCNLIEISIFVTCF